MTLVSGSRAFALAIIALSAFSIMASDALARPSICGKLERQLASVGGPSSSGNPKFQRAARAQAQQLQIARSQARRSGCGGSFLSFGSGGNSSSCSRLNSTIRRMESNLAKLQNKASSGGSGEMSRARLRAALDANDCNGRVIEVVEKRRSLPEQASQPRRSFLSQIFGGEVIERKTDQLASVDVRRETSRRKVKIMNGNRDGDVNEVDVEEIGPGGTFRTLCVRTCDGYYFPVSFSTTSSHFSNDEKSCSAMCPGAETKLFYHSIPDQEPEEMISLAREPYMSMPTAFKYRVDGINATPGCTCQAKIETEAAVDDETVLIGKRARWIAVPAPKPNPLEDIETAMNRAGALNSTAIANLIAGKAPTSTVGAGRKIRVVGPAFLPAQSRAEVLPVPGRVTVQ